MVVLQQLNVSPRAVDHEGKIGSVLRVKTGMKERTTACGALCALVGEITNGKLNLEMDPGLLSLLVRSR